MYSQLQRKYQPNIASGIQSFDLSQDKSTHITQNLTHTLSKFNHMSGLDSGTLKAIEDLHPDNMQAKNSKEWAKIRKNQVAF